MAVVRMPRTWTPCLLYSWVEAWAAAPLDVWWGVGPVLAWALPWGFQWEIMWPGGTDGGAMGPLWESINPSQFCGAPATTLTVLLLWTSMPDYSTPALDPHILLPALLQPCVQAWTLAPHSCQPHPVCWIPWLLICHWPWLWTSLIPWHEPLDSDWHLVLWPLAFFWTCSIVDPQFLSLDPSSLGYTHERNSSREVILCGTGEVDTASSYST